MLSFGTEGSNLLSLDIKAEQMARKDDNVFPVLTLFKSNIHTPAQAGKNLANLAYSEKYKDLKEIYFSDGKVVKTSVDSYNRSFQKDLWNGSLDLTKTTFTE
mgnify:CR=1 FL=1